MATIMFATSFRYYYDQIDIHLHDTYYVIPVPLIFWAFTLFLLLFWVSYHLTFRLLFNNGLIWLHIISTFFFWPLTVYIYGFPLIEDATILQYNFATWEVIQRRLLTQEIIMLAFTGLQVLYLFNLIGGVIKVVTKSSK
ncbi:hypothetical protein [Chitinophaga filiformis]|nr:hypothetical protein [Chitinophaga filiformis]